MKMYMNKPFNLTKSSDELKQLIAENPDLPIVVLVGQDAVSDDYGYTYCSDIHFSIEEILDYALPLHCRLVRAVCTTTEIPLKMFCWITLMVTKNIQIYLTKNFKPYYLKNSASMNPIGRK